VCVYRPPVAQQGALAACLSVIAAFTTVEQHRSAQETPVFAPCSCQLHVHTRPHPQPTAKEGAVLVCKGSTLDRNQAVCDGPIQIRATRSALLLDPIEPAIGRYRPVPASRALLLAIEHAEGFGLQHSSSSDSYNGIGTLSCT
jgi:hypothetical protein